MARRNNGRARRKTRFENQINVTPLVDVMLVLLIIFMVAAPMMTNGINVDLPKTSAHPINSDTKPITVSMKEDGKIYLADDALSPEELVSQLKNISHNDSSRRIYVKADARIDYGKVMTLMGRITSSGFNHVALLAQEPSGQ